MTFSPPRYGGDSARKVWLTFDDGPHPEYTDRVLDVLQSYGISATFFVLGANVDRWGTTVLERMGTEGHSIGNHAYSHADLTSLTDNEVRDEIKRTEAMIGRLPNAEKVFRPPYGASSRTVDRVARELDSRDLGVGAVLWESVAGEWKLIKCGCSEGYEVTDAPTEPGMYEGQIVKTLCEPVAR